MKWVPRSELTLKGSPNLEKMWFINRQAVVSAVSLGAGRHSIHFVNSQVVWILDSVGNFQHTRHPLTYSATSCCMPGQYATCLSVS